MSDDEYHQEIEYFLSLLTGKNEIDALEKGKSLLLYFVITAEEKDAKAVKQSQKLMKDFFKKCPDVFKMLFPQYDKQKGIRQRLIH